MRQGCARAWWWYLPSYLLHSTLPPPFLSDAELMTKQKRKTS